MVVTNIGINGIRDAIVGAGPTFDYAGMGIGTTAATYQDTTLESEVDLNSTNPTANRRSLDEQTLLDKELRFTMVIPTTEGNGNDLTEVAVYNAISDGVPLNHIVHAPVSKTDDIELTITVIMKLANY